jgi:hypothetical protein
MLSGRFEIIFILNFEFEFEHLSEPPENLLVFYDTANTINDENLN